MASNTVLREHVHTILRRAPVEGLLFGEIFGELHASPDWANVEQDDLRAVLYDLEQSGRVEFRPDGRYCLRES